jgi:predicted nucleic acid-binding protein
VAAKWLVPEPGSAEAEAILAQETDIHAPALLLEEIANVLFLKVRRGELTAEAGRKHLAGLQNMVDTLVPADDLCREALGTGLSARSPGL